jgi:hypothetical protein
MPDFLRHPASVARAVRVVAGALLLITVACETPEDRIAGRYVRTWKEGVTPERGFGGDEPDVHVLVLNADRTWASEHPFQSIQQFDVPSGGGTYYLNGVTLTLRPTELGPMAYTVSGDTLFPRTPEGVRRSEAIDGYSMGIGTNTYLLRER